MGHKDQERKDGVRKFCVAMGNKDQEGMDGVRKFFVAMGHKDQERMDGVGKFCVAMGHQQLLLINICSLGVAASCFMCGLLYTPRIHPVLRGSGVCDSSQQNNNCSGKPHCYIRNGKMKAKLINMKFL